MAVRGAEEWWRAPELPGSHVVLRALRPEDAQGLLAAADADAVFAHLTVARPRTLAEAERQVADAIAAAGVRDVRGRVPFVQLTPGGEVVGTTSYYEVVPGLRTLAVGHTWLARRAQRTGVNTEAKLLLLTRAFDELGAVRVVWHTDVRNEQSQAAIARLGATREGLLRKHRLRRDGSWRDTVQFSMTDDDWPAVRDRLAQRLRRGAAAS